MSPRSLLRRLPAPGELWRRATLAAVVIVALVNVAVMTRDAFTQPPPHDSVMPRAARLAPLRAEIAARGLTGVVGYVGDRPGYDLWQGGDAVIDYYIAQFLLAPLVLDPNPQHHRWAIANLREVRLEDALPPGLRPVAPLGEGVWLLERKAP